MIRGELREGQFYETRDGRKAGPAKRYADYTHPCCEFTVPLDGHPATYWADGSRLVPGGKTYHEDLIRVWRGRRK